MVTNLSEVLKMVQNEKPQQCLPTVGERGDEREEEKEERVPSIRKEEDGKEEDREEDGYTYYDAAQLEAVVPDILRPIAASLTQEPHVLAVDDNSIERRVIETLLKASSCRVTAVESVARALDVLGVVGSCCSRGKASQINLIVTDYCMPGMTGYDLLKKVKSIPSLRDIPVVIMSSEDVKDRIDRCYAEGAKEFVLKPVKLVDVKRLREHILPPKKVVTIEQPPLSIPIRGKRKLISSEALPSQNSDRHPRLEAVTVT